MIPRIRIHVTRKFNMIPIFCTVSHLVQVLLVGGGEAGGVRWWGHRDARSGLWTGGLQRSPGWCAAGLCYWWMLCRITANRRGAAASPPPLRFRPSRVIGICFRRKNCYKKKYLHANSDKTNYVMRQQKVVFFRTPRGILCHSCKFHRPVLNMLSAILNIF